MFLIAFLCDYFLFNGSLIFFEQTLEELRYPPIREVRLFAECLQLHQLLFSRGARYSLNLHETQPALHGELCSLLESVIECITINANFYSGKRFQELKPALKIYFGFVELLFRSGTFANLFLNFGRIHQLLFFQKLAFSISTDTGLHLGKFQEKILRYASLHIFVYIQC